MRTLIIFIGLLSFQIANCQTGETLFFQKIGYADTQLILSKMPEYNRIQNDLQLDIMQYENQFRAKVEEFEAKLDVYRQGSNTMLEIVRIDKENELKRIQESIIKFRQEVQVSLRKKENDLLSPILNEVGRAVDEVAIENGFAFILNSRGPSEIFQYADLKFDISYLVLKKLGIDSESRE